VPRQSDEMCNWVEKKTQLHLTPTASAFDHAEFADLKPGDLLFWTNTTETKRKLPVTHVMIYLGKLKKKRQARRLRCQRRPQLRGPAPQRRERV
jgi:cell wall-associated NlpC family hydrolase